MTIQVDHRLTDRAIKYPHVMTTARGLTMAIKTTGNITTKAVSVPTMVCTPVSQRTGTEEEATEAQEEE